MKCLNHYLEAKQTKIFEDVGAFFAFSNKQLYEQRKPGVEYAAIGKAGMICPIGREKEMLERLDVVFDEAVKEDLAENGKAGVILRELGNHEYCVTGCIEDTANALRGYGITDEEIIEQVSVYNETVVCF